MTVAVVTDSTAYLPDDIVADQGLVVVPLSVVVGDETYVEGLPDPSGALVRALGKAGQATTSRPSPQVFLDVYEGLAAQGVTAIVSVHLSAALSGTYDAAVLAAGVAPVPVRVVDSASMGLGLGYAVLDALAVARDGGDADAVARRARESADASRVLFCVASLEFLRRGGRIGAASALLGSALAVKPILELRAGRIEPREKQRTMGRAVARLSELASEAAGSAGGRRLRIGVHHVDAPARAAALAGAVRESCGGAPCDDPWIVELGPVAAAHLGPGSIGLVTSPAW